jgi:glutamine amidotransferase
MGWNTIEKRQNPPHLEGVDDGAAVYFVHSYYPEIREGAADGLAVATCDYGLPFAAAVERGALFATQFHPEKSQAVGLRILANFAALAGETGATAAAR